MIARLLIEIGTEELPVGSVPIIRENLPQRLIAHFEKNALLAKESAFLQKNKDYGCDTTPRRISLWLDGVRSSSTKKSVTQKIMPLAIGFDEKNQPTEALIKKIKKMSPAPQRQDIRIIPQDPDGKKWLVWEQPPTTVTLESVLPGIIEQTLHRIPQLKEMRWSHTDLTFIRPIRHLFIIHGKKTIDVAAFHLQSTNTARGHRTLGLPHVVIESAEEYREKMKTCGFVVVNNEEREALIIKQVIEIAAHENLENPTTRLQNKDVMAEINNMVEYPKSYRGTFSQEFLSLPTECLELTMKIHQRYIPLRDHQEQLTNKFIVVANNAPQDGTQIVQGHERVLKARLSDAQFFYEQDTKSTLTHHAKKLSSIVYHEKLGSQKERTLRIRRLAKQLGGMGQLNEMEIQQLEEAATLSKADLVTTMVQEFPELQGIIGGYYARREEYDAPIVDAIHHQYDCDFSQREWAAVPLYLNISEKLENLVGLFAVNEKPTGEKDPFALRRKALGLVKAYLAYDFLPRLSSAIEAAQNIHQRASDFNELAGFITERAKNYLTHILGYDRKILDCLMADNVDSIADIHQTYFELNVFLDQKNSKKIVATRKRIENITKDEPVVTIFRPALILREEERKLWEEIQKSLMAQDPMTCLEPLSDCVTAFFDHVLIKDPHPGVRNNRIALLQETKALFDKKYLLYKLEINDRSSCENPSSISRK